MDKDIFSLNELLYEDRIKAYRVEGKSLEPLVNKNLFILIDSGLISEVSDKMYAKHW